MCNVVFDIGVGVRIAVRQVNCVVIVGEADFESQRVVTLRLPFPRRLVVSNVLAISVPSYRLVLRLLD